MDGQRPPGAAKVKSFDISEAEVEAAWKRVRARKGAPGVDAVSVEAFEAGLEDNLYRIWNRMSSGSYFPPPVRAVVIPKAHGPGTRMLGVPTIADRVAQTVVAARIEAAVEPVFHRDSFGYRPGRSPHDAVGRCRERCWSHDWVLDLDVAKFFDSVRWDLVIKAVERHVDLPWVILYVRRWLAAAVQMPDGSVAERDRGTPQGSAVSPVLANLFLHYAFDMWMAREFPDCPFERFADDAVVHCSSLGRARQVRAALEQRMEQVGLELHPDKTKIVYCRDGKRRGPYDGPVSFDFLGFTFRARSMNGRRGRFTGYGPAVSDAALAKMSQDIRSWRLRRQVTLSWAELVRWLGPVIRGWMNYYGQFCRSQMYPLLARINYHLQKWLRAKHKRFRNHTALRKAWHRAVTQEPSALPHWKWVTSAWQ
jgi:group II intron reverse transcriptase/maturase